MTERVIVLFVALVVLSMPFTAKAQKTSIDFFTLKAQGESIECVRVSAGDGAARPTVLFMMGSNPNPVVAVCNGKQIVIPLSNFDYDAMAQQCNFVIFSHPHIPALADVSLLNDKYQFVPDISQPSSLDEGYLDNNYLGKHVQRGNAVLEYLRQQPWVDQSRIILIGHSQGAHVAAHLAFGNRDVSALGYFGGNPLGRFSEMILRQRKDALKGNISAQEAQGNIEFLYDLWRDVCNGRDGDLFADRDVTWRSFSECYIEELSRCKVPVFVAYGTEDICAAGCDLLPVYFALAGKQDYRLMPMVGRGHNFEFVNPAGGSDWEDMAWDTVMSEFLHWCGIDWER